MLKMLPEFRQFEFAIVGFSLVKNCSWHIRNKAGKCTEKGAKRHNYFTGQSVRFSHETLMLCHA